MVICLERGADLHMAQLMPHASLHLAPDRQPHQHPTTLFFTGRMPFLPPNQQRQSIEGKIQIGFTFLVLAYPGSPGQRAVKRVCVVYVVAV